MRDFIETPTIKGNESYVVILYPEVRNCNENNWRFLKNFKNTPIRKYSPCSGSFPWIDNLFWPYLKLLVESLILNPFLLRYFTPGYKLGKFGILSFPKQAKNGPYKNQKLVKNSDYCKIKFISFKTWYKLKYNGGLQVVSPHCI